MRNLIPVLLLGSAVAACSGGGSDSGGGGGTVVTPTPTPAPGSTPTPTPTTTPTPTPASTEPATGTDFLTGAALLYSTAPSIAACNAGTLKAEVGARVLATLNDIRAHHNLPAVTYAAADEPAVQQSALMMAANGQLSHNPPASWRCYTSTGATASGQSNIYLGNGGGLRYSRDADIMIGWLTDTNNLVANNIGHRRWLLYPFLSTIAYGRVAGAWQTSNRADGAAIKVINSSQNTAGPLPDYVAYPFEDYPARYYENGALLSFGVIANKSSNFGTNSAVNFSAATISVRVRGGAALTVSNVSYDNDGYGLPNNLQWSVSGLTTNTIYDVTISNVTVSGSARSYSYYFRLVP